MFGSLFAKLCVAVGLLTAGGGQGTVVRPAEDDREEKEDREDKKQREEAGVYITKYSPHDLQDETLVFQIKC